MEENKIYITVEPWSKIYKELPINNNNKGFFKLLNEVYSKLDEKEAYVYYADYKFGEKIISEGNIPIEHFELKNLNNNFSKNNDNFKKDIEYSTDPLGVILKNKALISTNSHNVRLSVLEEGQLFGVFGTLDFFNFEKKDLKGKEDWNVISGDSSFHLLFDFELRDNDELESEILEIFVKKIGDDCVRDEKTSRYSYKDSLKKTETIVELISKLGVETSKTRVIYLPKHIFDDKISKKEKDTLLKVKYHIYKKGWEQSKPLRNVLFEDGYINSQIRQVRNIKNKEALITLYTLCYHIANGEKEGLMLLDNKDLVELDIIDKFKKKNTNYFLQKKHYSPVILKYKKIKTKNDFAVLSLNHLPLQNVNKANFEDFKRVVSDIDTINNEMNHSLDISFYNRSTFTNCRVEVHKKFINFLINNGGVQNFNFTIKEHQKLLIIKSNLDNLFPKYYVLEELKKEINKLDYDLSDYYIISVQHLLRSTGSLFEALIDIGFKSKNIYLTGKIYSTHKETKDLLNKDLKINIIESTIDEPLGNYSNGLKKDISKMWDSLLKEIEDKPNSKIIVLDDGGYTLKSVSNYKEKLKNHKVFGIEQTTSGIKKRAEFEKFPIIDVAASAAKVLIEPLLVSEAVNIQLHDKFMEYKPENIGIIGFGHIGKAIAKEYNEKGYNIFIFDEVQETISGLEKNITKCTTERELYEKSDIIIGATGKDISKNHWLNNSNGDKVFMSVSSGDIEFNRLISENANKFIDLETEENKKKPEPLRIKILETTNDRGDNHKLTLLRGGMVSNFTGSADSSPGEYIQVTRGLLFSAIIQIISNEEELENTVIKLDAELQKKVVTDWFSDQPEKKLDYSSYVLDIFKNIDSINDNSGGTL